MANDQKEQISDDSSENLRYLIVRPENGGIRDLYRFYKSADRASADKFLLSSDDDVLEEELLGVGGSSGVGDATPDRRWVIVVSIIVRKIILLFGKPMGWGGALLEFLLNLLSENGGLLGLILNIIGGNMVMPKRGSETYISAIGHLDSRIDLFKSSYFTEGTAGHFLGGTDKEDEPGNRAIMDLCMMASKLSYENVKVVRNVVNLHWKMHFVDFYNCWNDYQKERSTQVFILCDKPKDANIILISFRGTEPFDADDWITDWDYSWYEIPKLGKVHMGFLEALGLGNRTDTKTFHNLQPKGAKFASSNGFSNSKSVPKGTESSSSSTQTNGVAGDEKKAHIPEMVEMTAYFAVRSKLRSLLHEHKNAKFIVTGHSLGGALAILFPTVLELHEETEMMDRLSGVYTYGQPRVGNQQLGKFMEARLDGQVTRYFRVVYCNDLVPRLPYDDKTFLYKHFGECLYYNSLYTEQKVDEEPDPNYFGLWFVIPVYVNAAWELIRSLLMGYTHGPEYKEGWPSVMLRVVGLAIPGLSAHSPTNYVNSIRLGREKTISMSSL